MIRKLRKGFTIVELVIVISVIAVLTAVLIPTFIHLSKKAKSASDNSLVANLNTALKMDAGEGHAEPKTMQDAVDALKRQGYLVPQLTTKSEEKLVYSIEKNEFCLSDKVAEGEEYKYWHIEKGGMPSSQSFSIYAFEWTETAATDLTVGFDAGEEKGIVDVSFVRGGGSEVTPREVIIRTNGGTLNINAPVDNVKHFGDANIVDIVSVAPTSYVEYGTVSMAKIKTGRVVITEDALLTSLHVVETNGSYEGIKVAVVGNADLPSFTRDDVTLNNGDKKLVIEVQSISSEEGTDEHPEYIWVSKAAGTTSTNVASSGTVLDEGTIIPETSQTSAAKTAASETEVGITAEELEEMEEVTSRYAGGKGTEVSPYLLVTKAHFGSMDEEIHDGLTAGKYYRMVTNVDLGEMSPLGWMTLSGKASDQGYVITGDESFNGNLDGGNHTLKYKMRIGTDYSASTAGLFGSIQDCTISNLAIEADLNCSKGVTWVGAIAGFGMSSNLKNVTVNGSIYGKHDVGGFFGYYGNDSNNNNNTIENCINNATVTNESDRKPNYSPTGGFVGQLSFNNVDYTLIFKNCVNNGAVKTTNGGYSATSHFVGFVSDNAASKGYDVRVCFDNCSVGNKASVSSTISTIRIVGNKSVYCCATEDAISACPAIKFIGITSNLCSATASPTKVYINDTLQDMSLYFAQ